MKTQLLQNGARSLALPLVFAAALAGCESESLLLTGPAGDTVGTIASDAPISTSAEESDVDDGTIATTDDEELGAGVDLGSDEDFLDAEDTVVLSDPTFDADALGDDVAANLIAERTEAGPVKVMAVGDSITHGISGGASYRREFTALLEAASCSFTMVGSQQTSLVRGDPNCIDTGVIGDGWGWNGVESCVVTADSGVEPYVGAHEGYSSHRADHFLTGHVNASGDNAGIQVAMETYDPDVVLLHVGSVDMFHEQTVESTITDINNVLDTIYETKSDTVVLIANIIPWYSDNPYPEIGEDVEAVGDGVEALVAERLDPLLKLVDVRSGYTEEMMMRDLIHPNETGEAHIADAFVSVYQPLAACSPE